MAAPPGLLEYLVMFIWFWDTSMMAAWTSGLLNDRARSGSPMIIFNTCTITRHKDQAYL